MRSIYAIYACFTGRGMVVSDNVVVGHLGYGPQTKAMVNYYLEHKDRFASPYIQKER